jgi:ABC-2 type transport system permease protein
MSALLQAELIKLRTTRTFIALAGVAVGTSLLLVVLVSLLTDPTKDSVLVDVFLSDTSGLFILVLAVVGISGEWRHRTITSSLLAMPDRVRFLAAKTLAFAATGLLLSLAISIAVTVAGVAILSARDLPVAEAGEMVDLYARNALVAALLGAFGVGIGALVRNQVAAIVGVLLLMLVVEPAVLALAPDVGRFAPFGALPTAVTDVPPDAVGMGDVDLLPPGLAVLALLGWIGAAFAAAAALLRGRDLH